MSNQNTKTLPALGARFRLTAAIERFPHFRAPAGATGTVTESCPDVICLHMDEYLPGAEPWDNEIVWTIDNDYDENGEPSPTPSLAAAFHYDAPLHWRNRRSPRTHRHPRKRTPSRSSATPKRDAFVRCKGSPTDAHHLPEKERKTADLPLAVWPCAQQTSQWQRHGRYVPASHRHPAKMLPALARRAIETYSERGDLVVDPMCGIGTTLVEAS